LSDYDSPWKEALDVYFEPFVALLFPAAHAEIDWSRGYEPLDKELQKIAPRAETGRRTVDKLMKVWRQNGEEEWVLIHVEVQAQEDPEFVVRMYVYNYRLFDRYNRKVVSLAVLGDDQPGWRPDRFGYDLWGCTIDFRFPVVKLLDYAGRVEELERDPNPFAAVVLAHVKAMETRRNAESRWTWKVRLIKGLYERGLDREEIRRLFRLIDWIMALPKGLDRKFWLEIEKFEEARKMPYITSVERLGMEKGKKEGKKEGRKEGLRQGIEIALKTKFGEQGCKVLDNLRDIDDDALLGRILERILTARSLDELRQIAAQVRPEQHA
jgi:hypothetical protein